MYSVHATVPLPCNPGSFLRIMLFTFCLDLCGSIPLSMSDFYRFTIPARDQGRIWFFFFLNGIHNRVSRAEHPPAVWGGRCFPQHNPCLRLFKGAEENRELWHMIRLLNINELPGISWTTEAHCMLNLSPLLLPQITLKNYLLHWGLVWLILSAFVTS